MKISVIGGAGFIGCVLLDKLVKEDDEIFVFDNFRKGIKGLKNGILKNKPNNLYVEYGDITNPIDIEEHLIYRKPDCIVLLAGVVGLDDCNDNPEETRQINVDGWKNIGEICYDIPVIAASTGSVYGKLDEVCTESSPTNPCSLYGVTKLEGEKPILDIGGVILRFATAGGVSPNMRFSLLPNTLTYEAVNYGELSIFQPDVRRTFIDIRDFANSFIFSINNYQKMKGEIYNVGDEDNNWTKRQMVEYIKNKTGCSVTYNDDRVDPDLRDYSVNFSKLSKLQFKCEYSVEKMLDNLIDYFEKEERS